MDFLYRKHPKGTYEHADHKKKVDTFVMIILFAMALGLYVIGRVTTGSNRNILTIVAVLGLLPACKMVVDVIMSLRVKRCEPALKEKIDDAVGGLDGLYNMYFTSYNRNYLLAHLVIAGNSVIGLSVDKDFDENGFKAHLTDLLLKEGLKDVLIKVFTDDEKYVGRLRELNDVMPSSAKDSDIHRLILNVTL